jgi:hypothetical protein
VDNNVIASGGFVGYYIKLNIICTLLLQFVFFYRSDGKLLLWDIRSSKSCLMSFDSLRCNLNSSKRISNEFNNLNNFAHEGSVLGITFTNNGNYLVSIGKDNHMRLWNVFNGLNTFVNFGKISLQNIIDKTNLQISTTEFNDNNNYIFIPNSKNITAFDMFSGNIKKVLKGHFDSTNCCLYNPNVNEIYSGSKDKNMLIWSSNYVKEKTDLKRLSDLQLETTSSKRPCTNLNSWSDNDSD